MRKIVFILMMVLSINCFSQDHLKFMGLSMGVNLETMCVQLKQKGFHGFGIYGSIGICQGQFYGEDCQLSIVENKDNVTLSMITVMFNDKQWIGNKKEQVLNSLKEDLKKKYTDYTEKENDITFKTESGNILLSVSPKTGITITYINHYTKDKKEDL